MKLLDHVSITVRNLELTKPFYMAVMSALEASIAYEDSDAIGFGERNSPGDDSHTYLSIFESTASIPDPRRHWCLRAKSIAQVNAFYTSGLAAGGSDCGAPGIREYHQNYYAAFLLDPEGNKIEAVFHCGKVKDSMAYTVETFTPPNTPTPIGPYNHIAKFGPFLSIGGTAGVNPKTNQLAGDIYSQAKQILESFSVMLESAGSDLGHILHVNIFLKNMQDFEELNRAYVEIMGSHLPARTVIGVSELPKPGVLVTMNLTAVTKD